ncbi:unnamed protein product [Plutella xylostella]|uniref:(diamondback moth) hypothetical protein n=1 Tax=Plutella xylostella TaxID=51655 RepID=A0A8S4GD68_PLUXY|nr:unnamed protein product [Plutella xylostella]
METNYASSKSPAIESLEQAIEDLKMELQDRDQDLLENDIQITHIPETKAENPLHLVKVIAVKLGMTLDERDIVSAVRVGALRPAAGAAEGAAAAAARARPLAVRLARRATRDELLCAMRVRRGLTTADMGLEGEPKRFYINERLTKLNRQLFGKARDLGKRFSWRFIWTKDGRVFLRQAEGKPSFRIRCVNDLTNIFGEEPVRSTL